MSSDGKTACASCHLADEGAADRRWMTSIRHLEQLLLGWLYFPIRTIPQMTIDPPAVYVGLICLKLFVMAIYFGGLRVLRRGRGVEAQTHVWTLGSALASVFLFLALFASGISFVGICHQVVWMWSGRGDRAEDSPAAELGIIAILTEQTDHMQAKFQLQSLSLAIQNYHDTHDELPPGGTMTEHGELLHGWLMLIGPYDTYIAPQLDERISWRKPPNAEVYQCQGDRFLNPSMSGEVFDKDGFGGPPGWNGAMFAMCDGSVQLLSESTDPKVLKALGTPAGND